MEIIKDLALLRQAVQGLRSQGKRIGFVPTMGALHDGHLSLVDCAKQQADIVVASIFVNPTQFAAGEDLSTYPRTEEEDCRKLEAQGVDYVYMPDAVSMYPEHFSTSIKVDGLSKGLCGDVRPHFFGGVALVVCKLLMRVMPDVAVFGEKDYQQLQVVKRMVRDLDIPTEIIGGAIIREDDGLAMSSRNRYLSEKDRAIAPILYQTLCAVRDAVQRGVKIVDAIQQAEKDLIAGGVDSIDYFEVRDADTLEVLNEHKGKARIFGAVRIGGCRILDNVAL